MSFLSFPLQEELYDVLAFEKKDTEKFLEMCGWIIECWSLTKQLFDKNEDISTLENPYFGTLFRNLNVITTEYSLFQIIKIHDPAVQGKGTNLSIDFIVDYGGWDQSTCAALNKERAILNSFAAKIKDARDKLLSHNDLEIIRQGQCLGSLNLGDDETYIESLIRFCEVISSASGLGPFCHDQSAQTDVLYLMKFLKMGIELTLQPSNSF